MMDKLQKMLDKKHKKSEDPMKKEAKLNVLKDLRGAAVDSMRDNLAHGLKKVSVMSDDKEGLKEGLDKAKELLEEVPDKSPADMEEAEERHEEDMEDESEEAEEPEDVDAIEAKIKALMEKKQALLEKKDKMY
jgi:hypothetical protein